MKNDGGINDWGLNYNMDYRLSSKKLRDRDKTRFAVRLCPSCNFVYENTYNQYKSVTTTHKYEEFPTIGLRRAKCPQCN